MSGSIPRSIAEASTKALNVEPAWRVDCAARLNWFFVLPGMTAVIARIAPVPGSTETMAAAGSLRYGSVWRMALFAARWRPGSMVV